MVDRKDYYSSDDKFDRIERIERILALLAGSLLREWRDRYSYDEDLGRGRYGEFPEYLSYGPLNSYLDRLLRDLVEAGRGGSIREIPDLLELSKTVKNGISNQRYTTDKLSKELHSLIYLLHAGIDPREVKGVKLLPIRIYTSEDGYKVVGPIERAIRSLLDDNGIIIDDEFPPVQGSWFKQLIGKTKEAATSEEVSESLKKIRHGVEIETLHKGQAEVNKAHAEAIKDLMAAMADTDNAACSIGSILIVKITKNGRSSVMTKTLTQREMMAIEDNQAILMDPATIFEKLDSLCTADPTVELPDTFRE